MREFSKLYQRLDQTTKTTEKIKALKKYFQHANEKDKLWAIALFSHRRPRRTVKTTMLREWAAEKANIPLWLFDESYHVVGDLAETIALVLPEDSAQSNLTLSDWIMGIKGLVDKTEEAKKTFIINAWSQLSSPQRFLLNKLITGGFRVGVSQKLVVKALAQALEQEENVIAHRLMGKWDPETSSFQKLLIDDNPMDDISKPYPFYLAYGLEDSVESLGNPEEWQAEQKWDGIRGQLIKRKGELFLWSRGEELVTDKYPEFEILKTIAADDFVLDGEVLPFKNGYPLSFQELQTRIGRKQVGKNILQKTPVVLMTYDLLEVNGKDIRSLDLRKRRLALEKLITDIDSSILDSPIRLSKELKFRNWEEVTQVRQSARDNKTEGLMMKRKDSIYKSGRKKGDWWKWKVDPLTIDAVMIYAMRGHGRRANLYTDFTFAVWNGNQLVPFTKAYSGLRDEEFLEITRYVQRNTIDRFGPVRQVQPNLVFEIAFEGINLSKRHKSGIALRFPRIKRWRKDKHPKEANTLEDLKSFLPA